MYFLVLLNFTISTTRSFIGDENRIPSPDLNERNVLYRGNRPSQSLDNNLVKVEDDRPKQDMNNIYDIEDKNNSSIKMDDDMKYIFDIEEKSKNNDSIKMEDDNIKNPQREIKNNSINMENSEQDCENNSRIIDVYILVPEELSDKSNGPKIEEENDDQQKKIILNSDDISKIKSALSSQESKISEDKK